MHGLEIQEKSLRQEIERAERHRQVVADETVQIEKEIIEIQDRISEAETIRTTAKDLEPIAAASRAHHEGTG